jgi:hypothetical protein
MDNCDILMFSKRFKEKIKEIPDDINDEKHITQYIKNIMKEISEEKKLKDFKKKKMYRQTEYQKFIKGNKIRIRDENPALSKTECMSLLIKEWKLNKINKNKKDNKVIPLKTTPYILRNVLVYLICMIF